MRHRRLRLTPPRPPATRPRSEEATTTAEITEDYDPDGVLRVGTSLDVVGGLHFDPTKTVDQCRRSVADADLRDTRPAQRRRGVRPVVGRVRRGHRSVDAHRDAARRDSSSPTASPTTPKPCARGILRNLNEPADPGVAAGRHSLFKELADITVAGPLQLTFTLKTPVAGEFMSVLAGRESAVPSPKAIADGVDLDANPVGAGPFVLEEFQPSELVSLRRSPTFFAADAWKLGGIDFVHVAQGAATTTALLAGQIDDAQLTTADSRPPAATTSSRCSGRSPSSRTRR